MMCLKFFQRLSNYSSLPTTPVYQLLVSDVVLVFSPTAGTNVQLPHRDPFETAAGADTKVMIHHNPSPHLWPPLLRTNLHSTMNSRLLCFSLYLCPLLGVFSLFRKHLLTMSVGSVIFL